MKMLLGFCLLSVALSSQAEIYKCSVNGKSEFSDQPCSEHAEKIELKVYQPKSNDVATQQELTRQFKEDARVNEIESLKAKNEQLKSQVTAVAKQWDAEMKALQAKTFSVSDDQVATHEKGLFKKMDETRDKYQQQIEKIQDQIKQNERRLNDLAQSSSE